MTTNVQHGRHSTLLQRWSADFGLEPGGRDARIMALAERMCAGGAPERVQATTTLLTHPSVCAAIARAAHVRILRRLPDANTLAHITTVLGSGANWTGIVQSWFASDEYFAQRAHESNALFVSVLARDLMLPPLPNGTSLEVRLDGGTTREAIVRELIDNACANGDLPRLMALRFGLVSPPLRSQGAFEGDPLKALLVDVLASDEYLADAAKYGSALASIASKMSGAVAAFAGVQPGNESQSGSLYEGLRAELGSVEFAAGAIFRWLQAKPEILEHELNRSILPAVASIGASEAAIATARGSIEPQDVQALLTQPLASAVSALLRRSLDLDRFPDLKEVLARLDYGGGLVEAWEAGLRTFMQTIVSDWASRASFAPDEQRLRDWSERLLANEYYIAVLAEFLSGPAIAGADPVVFFDGTLSIARPAGSCVHNTASHQQEAAAENRMRLATTFFYWYDVYHNRELLSSPDDTNLSDSELALTVRPPTLEDFSYLSFAWNHKEFADMRHAGIDVVMPVYYGTPISDPIELKSDRDAARNVRNNFAEPGLRMIRRVMPDLAPDMRIAMFYDSTTTNRVNAKSLHVDFRFGVAYDWFYETIRSFFSHIPRHLWALRDGRPIILVYHPCFGVNLTRRLYPHVRHRFKRDFGVDPFIVTASEEEAPRVLQNDYVKKVAQGLNYNNWREKLADLVADDPLYQVAGGDNRRYADVLQEALLGQAQGPAAFHPYVDFACPSGRIESSTLATPEALASRAARADDLAKVVSRLGRRKAALDVLASAEFIDWQVADWLHRYLRVESSSYTPAHRQLADALRRDLHAGAPWAVCLQKIFETPFFAAAAGGEDRVVDLIYQLLVWRFPNPDYVNNHTTIDDAGRKEFLSRAAAKSKSHAIRWFLERFEVAEAVASDWLFKYYGWYNPGIADSSFYWGGAIAPVIRDVAAVGPGYDQSAIRTRPGMFQPRHDGARYRDCLSWVASMNPQPWLLHLETWNEFFEGSTICDCEQFGRQYIEITREFAPSALPTGARQLEKPPARADEDWSTHRGTLTMSNGTHHAADQEAPKVVHRVGTARELEAIFKDKIWHQRWEVIPGVFTPGGNSIADIMRWAGVPASLEGKRVLDIGSWNGCCSFECERRGAAEVIAIGPENPDHAGFTELKAFLGSKVEYRLGTIYDLQPDRIGKFDLVLCFGVLYHLRHPLLGLDMVRRVCGSDLHLETYYMPDQPGQTAQPLLEFYRKAELNGDPSNWFGPNKTALEGMIASSGFDVLSLSLHPNNRAAAHARITPGAPEWMTMGTGEGFYYETITRPVLGRPDVY